MMERQLEQMVRLVDDLLDVSRITRGRLEMRKEQRRPRGRRPQRRRDVAAADRCRAPRARSRAATRSPSNRCRSRAPRARAGAQDGAGAPAYVARPQLLVRCACARHRAPCTAGAGAAEAEPAITPPRKGRSGFATSRRRIGDKLGVPVAAMTEQDAASHFGWLARLRGPGHVGVQCQHREQVDLASSRHGPDHQHREHALVRTDTRARCRPTGCRGRSRHCGTDGPRRPWR